MLLAVVRLSAEFAAPAVEKASTSCLRGGEEGAVGADDLLGSFLALVAVLTTAVEEDCLLPGGAVPDGSVVVLPVPLPLRDVQANQWVSSLCKQNAIGANQRNIWLFMSATLGGAPKWRPPAQLRVCYLFIVA